MTDKPMRKAGMNRRSFCKATGATAMVGMGPVSSFAQENNPDVVIVGAGAAGIAAAHELQAQGVSYVHIEAASHVGGRAFSESATFGVPYDHGAHWVQNGSRNPYYQRAQKSAHRFYPAADEYLVLTGDRVASEAEQGELWNAYDDTVGAISKAGRKGHDVAPSKVVPTDTPWSSTAAFLVGPWEMGKDMDNFSCLDWWNSADSVDYYCDAGYGALVAARAAGLPISLNTPATLIRWDGPGVEVKTPKGTIRAKAVIITVSTSVLAEEAIAFSPPLPAEKQESFHAIEMGDYNHIALMFDADIFGLGEDGYVVHQVNDSNDAFGALTNTSGSGLAYCDVGGTFARELEDAGQEEAIDFVLGVIRNAIGSDVDAHYQRGTVSAWRSDPLVRGCYASAAPGAYKMRPVLREPVADRLFFAGEACHLDMWATVGGADLSGQDTAREVAKALA